ncbi:MAG: YajD family HNH nuclease [Burkholderiales bacterium]|nr:YajD family HNH nuclease [Burkholderiales bacterium]
MAEANRSRAQRELGYRERALKIHPWICARCGREFTPRTVHQLTVHHRDHNHDNNPPDGSNWELLCIYCHENEHSRLLDHAAAVKAGVAQPVQQTTTYRPFANLKALLQGKEGKSPK